MSSKKNKIRNKNLQRNKQHLVQDGLKKFKL